MQGLISDDALDVDTLLLNVAIIPSESVSDAAVELSRQLPAYGGLFQLDGIDRFAHLTLYMARFSQPAVNTVRDVLANISQLPQGIRLSQAGYYVTPGSYYEVSYEASPDLLRLHTEVADVLRPFRFSPDAPVVEDYFGMYSDEQQANVLKYGYDLMAGLYRPHITLTRFGRQLDLGSLPTTEKDLSFVATKIGLFQADAMGAARQLIAAFDL